MFDIHGFEMTVFKLLVGVILIVLHLRITGKQQTTQMTPIDFIGNFILGGIIGGVIYNHAISFAEYVSVLLVTFAIISGFNYVTSKFMSTRSLVMGQAYTIIENGQFTQDALESPEHKLDPVEFLAELRGMGIFSLSDVRIAQREANGSLTVRRMNEGDVNYLLVSNGQIVSDNMELAGRSEEWLRDELEQAGAGALENLFLVELDAHRHLTIVDQSGLTTSSAISDAAVDEVTTVTEFDDPGTQTATLEDFIPSDAQPDEVSSQTNN
ncbi:DUF421 domain-containing protein [Actinomyces sp.]